MGASVNYIRAGGRMYPNDPEDEEQAITEETGLRIAKAQSEKKVCEKELSSLQEKNTAEKQRLEEAKNERKISEASARASHRGGILLLVLASILAMTCIGLVYWGIAPAFYGREEIACIISLGCGLATAIAGHMLLSHLEKTLNKTQLRAFIVLCSCLMLALAIGGSIFLGKARSLQWELQTYLESDSALDLQAKQQDNPIDIEELKKQIEQLTSRALILMAISLDFVAALLLFVGAGKLGKSRSVVTHAGNLRKLERRIDNLEKRQAYLESLTEEAIRSSVHAELHRAKNKGNLTILIIVASVFIASIVFFLLMSEGVAFGKEPGAHYLVALDVTGSTARDRRENERAILRIMDGLRPGDSISAVLITEKTFTNPEYLMSAKMPLRAGYFREEVIRAKRRLIHEFRTEASKLSDSRCSTSLLDGIYLFAQLIREHPAPKKVLVILSDMQQTAQNINTDKITNNSSELISQLKAEGLIPDMRGIEVHVLGVSTHGIDLRHWRKLEQFWRKYFEASGCDLKAYSISRHLNR